MSLESKQHIIDVIEKRYGIVLLGQVKIDAPTQTRLYTQQYFTAQSVWLFGNVGSSIWSAFSQSNEYHDGQPDPLDRWSQRIGDDLAEQLGGIALMPFAKAAYPFYRWAALLDEVSPSALAILMHRRYGLWHAYRFAIAMPKMSEQHESSDTLSDSCVDCPAPCLNHCPVNAFSFQQYDYPACIDYLAEQPDAPCNQYTCQARLACPVGERYQYEQDHGRFHMQQLLSTSTASSAINQAGQEIE